MRTTPTVPTRLWAPRPTRSGDRAARPARTTTALALALGAVLTLSACGSPEASDPTTTSSTAMSAASSSSEPSIPTGGTTSASSTPATTSAATGDATASASGSASSQAGTETLIVPAGSRPPQLTWSRTADPDVIAATFVAATWQMDTTTDTSPSAAQQRAAQLSTETLAATLAQAPVSSGGAAWSDLASRSGWTSVEASSTSTPDAPDSDTESYRLVNATITAHGSDGWTSADLFPPVVVYVSLVPDGASWRVEDATTYSS